MRLDKYLSDMNKGTRKEVKALIKAKRVKVDDKVITDSSYNVKDEKVYLDDELVTYHEFEYYLLNKPSGYVCANEDKFHKVVFELLSDYRKDLSCIGRLDKDTEGLLLISNDGTLNHLLMSPKFHVTKKYYLEVDGLLDQNKAKILEEPLDLGDFITKGSSFELIDENKAYMTISEGKYHQVKRMLEKVDCTVTYLKRVELAFLNLDGLEIGEYRKLTDQEVDDLYHLVK